MGDDTLRRVEDAAGNPNPDAEAFVLLVDNVPAQRDTLIFHRDVKVKTLEADGYLLIHGSGYVISKQHVHPNGTVQITLKRAAPTGG